MYGYYFNWSTSLWAVETNKGFIMKDLLILFTIASAGILCILVDVNVTIKPFKVQISNLKESIFIIAIFFLCTFISAISYNTGRQEGAKQAIELMNEINELEKKINNK